MTCQVDIFGAPRNVTLEEKKGECGGVEASGLLRAAKAGRLNLASGRVQSVHLSLLRLPSYPILPLPARRGVGGWWSVHILLHKHSCHLPQLQLLTLSPAGRCFWISHKVALWGLGGSISAFKFQPYQHPDGVPCSPSHKDHPSLGLQKCGFHPFVCPAFICSFHRNR